MPEIPQSPRDIAYSLAHDTARWLHGRLTEHIDRKVWPRPSLAAPPAPPAPGLRPYPKKGSSSPAADRSVRTSRTPSDGPFDARKTVNTLMSELS